MAASPLVVLGHELPSHLEGAEAMVLLFPLLAGFKMKFRAMLENEQVGFSPARNKSTIQDANHVELGASEATKE